MDLIASVWYYVEFNTERYACLQESLPAEQHVFDKDIGINMIIG